MPAFSRFLNYFLAVGRLGSIRRASEELNVSASAIDRQILNVEFQLGMPLFERLPTGLRLTAAGEILMAAGNKWRKNLAEIEAQLEDLHGLKRGHVDIAIIDALNKGFVPNVIQSIRTRYPGITIGIRVLENDVVRRAISGGEVDFGIFLEPQSFRDLTVRAFVDVVLGFVTPIGHAFGAKTEARFSSCINQKLILPAAPLAVAQQISILEGRTALPMNRAVTSDNVQMITSLVLQGAGVGILTSLDVAGEVMRGELSFTRISDSLLRPMTLALCTATSRTPSYAAAVVLSELEARFGELSLGFGGGNAGATPESVHGED